MAGPHGCRNRPAAQFDNRGWQFQTTDVDNCAPRVLNPAFPPPPLRSPFQPSEHLVRAPLCRGNGRGMACLRWACRRLFGPSRFLQKEWAGDVPLRPSAYMGRPRKGGRRWHETGDTSGVTAAPPLRIHPAPDPGRDGPASRHPSGRPGGGGWALPRPSRPLTDDGKVATAVRETGNMFATALEAIRQAPLKGVPMAEFFDQCWFLARVTTLPLIFAVDPLRDGDRPRGRVAPRNRSAHNPNSAPPWCWPWCVSRHQLPRRF